MIFLLRQKARVFLPIAHVAKHQHVESERAKQLTGCAGKSFCGMPLDYGGIFQRRDDLRLEWDLLGDKRCVNSPEIWHSPGVWRIHCAGILANLTTKAGKQVMQEFWRTHFG